MREASDISASHVNHKQCTVLKRSGVPFDNLVWLLLCCNL